MCVIFHHRWSIICNDMSWYTSKRKCWSWIISFWSFRGDALECPNIIFRSHYFQSWLLPPYQPHPIVVTWDNRRNKNEDRGRCISGSWRGSITETTWNRRAVTSILVMNCARSLWYKTRGNVMSYRRMPGSIPNVTLNRMVRRPKLIQINLKYRVENFSE